MNSSVFVNISSPAFPVGSTDISPIISVPLNGYILTLPSSKNALIKKISAVFVNSTNVGGTNEVVKFWNFRFRIRNRDISIQTNLAGNILNPISGAWDGSLTKDSIVDCMISSKKNFIEFPTPIIAGGIQFQTLRVIFNSPTLVTFSSRIYFTIQYDEQ
jgi:hypothetical protein